MSFKKYCILIITFFIVLTLCYALTFLFKIDIKIILLLFLVWNEILNWGDEK